MEYKCVQLNCYKVLARKGRMLNAPPLISLELHLSGIKCFSNILNAPLSDVSWKTEICRLEDLRGGAFSICQKKDLLQLSFRLEFVLEQI